MLAAGPSFFCWTILTRVSERPQRAAKIDFDRALELDDRCGEAYHFRALYCKRKKRYAESIGDFRREVECAPDNAMAHAFLAHMLAACPDRGLRDGEEALRHTARACALTDHREFFALRVKAIAHHELGQWKQAVECCERAISVAPLSERAKLNSHLQLYERKLRESEGSRPPAKPSASQLDPPEQPMAARKP